MKTIEELITTYTILLEHNEDKLQHFEKLYQDTSKLTFHAGFNKGYVQAKVTVLEDIVDDLKELKLNKSSSE